MCAKKKKHSFFQVEGFEGWMNQFFTDPYSCSHYPDSIRVDLFETEREYILEGDIPDACQTDIIVEKTKQGLRIIVQTKLAHARTREIQLPIDTLQKKMNASFANGLLEIHISKHEAAQEQEVHIHFPH